MKKNVLLLAGTLMCTIHCLAQTYLPSKLSCNQTLTLSGSPYIVDTSITIAAGCNLTVDAGVEIKMGDYRYLTVKGKVSFLGSAQKPIRIHAKSNQWGIIYLDSASQKSIFNYTIIENATLGPNGSDQNFTSRVAALSAYYSSFELDGCVFRNNKKSVFALHCDKILVKNCVFDSTNTGENILLQFADNSTVSGNVFYFLKGAGDHIDFDASKNIIIKDNYAFGGDADAIDIGQRDSVGCKGVLIRNNYLYNMGDKGVSNGEGSTNITIEYNVIMGCDIGFSAKDKSQVFADHNTLLGNRVGIKAYDHLLGMGGGIIVVSNTIIAGSIDSAYRKDPTASLTIRYCLSDTDTLPGVSNVWGPPKFVSSSDVNLTAASMAIDKGDTSFVFDPDVTRSDIGRFYFNQVTSGIQPLLIYPNPGNGTFAIQLAPDHKIDHLVVFNSLGQLVHEEALPGQDSSCSIHLCEHPPGVYYLRLLSEDIIVTRRLFVY